MKENDAPVDLCVEILRRLDEARVLQDVILVGSWCSFFYRDFFRGETNLSALRTRDMDLLIPAPSRIKARLRLVEMFQDLGFLPEHHRRGYMRLSHPDLMIDFLVPERGRGTDKSVPVKGLGVNAQPLRFLNLLSDDTVVVRSHGLEVVMPHPINYALQKLIISGRRHDKDKAAKDRRQASEVLHEIVARGEGDKVRAKFQQFPPGWKRAVLVGLRDEEKRWVDGMLEG